MKQLKQTTRLVVASLLLACTAAAQPARAVAEYADATRTVIVDTPPLWQSPPSLEFTRVTAIVPRPKGSFVVLDGRRNQLHFIAETGTVLASVGRRGAGPGEYQALSAAALLAGDTLAAFDPGARRISILAPDGTFVRSFALTPPFEGGGSPTRFAGLLTGELLVGYSEIQTMTPQPNAAYFGQRFFAYNTVGTLRSPTGFALPNTEHFVQAVPPSRGGVAYWNLAFGRVMTVRADSATLWVGDGTIMAVERRSATGAVLQTLRVARAPVPVSAEDRAAHREQVLAGSTGEQRLVMERLAAEMPYPRHKPTYRRFELDEAGILWLEVYPARAGDAPPWLRVDTRRVGPVLAVQFPAAFRPLAFRGGRVYGSWRDADDVETVRVYRAPR